MLKHSLPLLLVALALPACKTTTAASGPAQAQMDPGPVAAFDAYMVTMQTSDWEGSAALMHPDALAEMHEAFVGLARVDTSGEVAQVFFGLETAEQVEALTPPQVFASLMEGMVALKPGMDQMFRDSTYQVIGTVPEGDVVHVLYRLEMHSNGGRISKLAVSPFRQHDGEWMALLTGELEGLLQALKGAGG